VLTVLNVIGLRAGTRTQNILTFAKLVGLVAVFIAGVLASPLPPSGGTPHEPAPPAHDLLLATIFVLFTYGGWNDISYVAAEVRDPQRNLTRALILGVAAVTAIYLLVNTAFLAALGFDAAAKSPAIAADAVSRAWGPRGSTFISALICVSTLGAIHGMVMTGSRVYYAMGRDHRIFDWLGRWDGRFGTPVRSLALQGVVTTALILAFGDNAGGFERMVVFTTPVYYFFLMLVGISVFVLRRRDREVQRTYRVAAVVALLFIATCALLLYSSVDYAARQPQYVEAIWIGATLASGLAVCLLVPDRAA
jgi:amino acid transporter